MEPKNKIYKCIFCSLNFREIKDGIYYPINGICVCPACAIRGGWTCNACFEKLDKTTIIVTQDHSVYCPKCYPVKTAICSDCKKDFAKTHLKLLSDQTLLCGLCFDKRYYKCIQCMAICITPCLTFCDNCSGELCQDCFISHPRNCEYAGYGSRQFSSAKHQGKTDGCKYIVHDRYVGVEIEAERGKAGYIDRALPKSVGICRDGSLGSSGIEVQTPPCSLNLLEAIVTEVCGVLKKRGFKGTKSCGLHVHMDASDFKDSPTNQKNLVQFIFATEDLLYSMLPTSRWGGHYSQMLNHQYVYKLFKKIKTQRGFDRAWYKNDDAESVHERKGEKYDSTRYFGLNIHSIFYRGTVEFRYHSGTVEESKILSWASILLHMLDYVVNHFDEDQVKKLYDTPTSLGKLEYLWDVISLPQFLRDYMYKRIQKFNPGFEVKFNKGKDFREMGDREKRAIIKKIEKLIEKQTAVELAKLKDPKETKAKDDEDQTISFNGTALWAQEINYYLSVGTHAKDPDKQRAENQAKTFIQKRYPNEYEIAFPSKIYGEKGFMKQTELGDKVKEINKKDKNREVEGDN